MTWWRIDLKYGPGRQSGHTDYVWQDEPVTKQRMAAWRDDLHEEFDDWEYGPAMVEIAHVLALPRDVHQRLMFKYQGAVESSRTMLAILSKSKVKA